MPKYLQNPSYSLQPPTHTHIHTGNFKEWCRKPPKVLLSTLSSKLVSNYSLLDCQEVHALLCGKRQRNVFSCMVNSTSTKYLHKLLYCVSHKTMLHTLVFLHLTINSTAIGVSWPWQLQECKTRAHVFTTLLNCNFKWGYFLSMGCCRRLQFMANSLLNCPGTD